MFSRAASRDSNNASIGSSRRNAGRRSTRLHSALLVGALALPVFSGCSSAGPWGFKRDYAAFPEEKKAADGAKEYDPVMAGRRFHEWVGQKVSIFGVVEDKAAMGDKTDLLLSVRVLQGRNLCSEADERSCRVTVSDHEFATIHALVQLTPEEQSGEYRLMPGSLVRVIGPISKKPHPKTGGTVIEASYHRHWPQKYFVTLSAREYMKR